MTAKITAEGTLTDEARWRFLVTHWQSLIGGIPLHRWLSEQKWRHGGVEAALDYDKDEARAVGVRWNDEPGMSLRDYFAAKAMQMEMQSARQRYDSGEIEADEWRQVQALVANYAYEMADEMLRARESVRAA
jgi:hypothetical protein